MVHVDLQMGTVCEYFGSDPATTNNRMELTGLLKAMDLARGLDGVCLFVSDSRYCLDGINKYLPAWKKRGWVKVDGAPVANRDLWEKMDALWEAVKPRSKTKWVEGHATTLGNVRADELSVAGRDQRQAKPYHGSLKEYGFDPLGEATPFYIVLYEGELRKFGSWPECQKFVAGKSSVKFKKVAHGREADAVVQAWTGSS